MTTEAIETVTLPVPRRAPLRRAPTGPGTAPLSALAIDFGTSTSTATLFDNSQGDLRALLLRRPGSCSPPSRTCCGPPTGRQHTSVGRTSPPRSRTGSGSGSLVGRSPAIARTWRHGWPSMPGPSETARALDSRRTTTATGRQSSPARRDLPGAGATALRARRRAVLVARAPAPRGLRAGLPQAVAGQPLLDAALPRRGLLERAQPAGHPRARRRRRGRLRRGEPQETDLGAFPGIKRYLNHPERAAQLERAPVPPGWQVDTDLLIGLAYADLADLLDDYADGVRSLQGRSLRRATVTYPTTTPPGPRRRLKQLLYDALDLDADISYDEATAAALFFVMRELGGDTARGIETLRATSRRSGPGSWLRTMLVIDIGGGTTDIALLDVELKELDSDQDGTDERNLVRGKHYLLRPRILGSSGHAQLGGDLLTLKVFYWMKAVIADALLIEQPDTLETMWAVAPTTAPTPRCSPRSWSGSARPTQLPSRCAPCCKRSCRPMSAVARTRSARAD